MYYYGNNGYSSYGCNPAPYANYVGTPYGYGSNACIWIVLFILLVIIIGAGYTFNQNA